MIDRRLASLGLGMALLSAAVGPARAEMSPHLYALALRQRIEQVATARKLRDAKLKGMVAISFQVDAGGRLAWRKLTSGPDAGVDALALCVIDEAQPFPPPGGLKDQVWVWLLLLDAGQSSVMEEQGGAPR